MPSPVLLKFTIAILLGLMPTAAWADRDSIPRESHPWGRFQPGAWKRVRVLTETLDEHGAVTGTSITETKTTLRSVSDEGVSLAVELLVEIAGKRLDAEPQEFKQGFHGELLDQKIQIHNLGNAELTVEGRKIACQMEQVESVGGTTKTRTKTYWSGDVAPYILKREITTTGPDGKIQSQSNTEVVALDMPQRVLGEILSTAHVRTVLTHAKGTITTFSVTSVDVPGGVICHTAKELDENGRLVRRSSLELVDYGLEPASDRWGLFQRLRGHRTHRSSRTTSSH